MIGSRHTFASYFAFAVDTILKVLWQEGYARGPQELVTLTRNRIQRLGRRFGALVGRWRAGTLPAVREGARYGGSAPLTLPLRGPLHLPQGERVKKAWGFPRGRGWIVRLLAPSTG